MFGPHRIPCETPASHPEGRVPGSDRKWVLPATILGSSLGFIDSSALNVALPAIRDDLAVNLATVQWVVNGYMLTLASLILLGGTAGDRYGRRLVFVVGLVAFAAASLACGLAPSAGWLICARFIQGAGAALLTPTSLAIIGAAYSGRERGPAIGTWAAAGALTVALGPPLGGWLVDSIGWRAIFFINLPLAALALLLAMKLPADHGERAGKLDVEGALLAITGLGLLSFGLISLGEGNSRAGAMAIAAAVPVGWLFLRTERRADQPMMPLDLFRNRNFVGTNILTILLYAALSGALFLLPFLLIEQHGYSTAGAGAAFLPFSIIMGLGSRWSGGLVARFGARLPLIVGPSMTAAGFIVLGLSGQSESFWSGFLPGLVIVAAGMTVSVAPLTTTVLNSVPDDRSGTASGVNNAAARVGGLLAVAALGLAFGQSAGTDVGGMALLEAYRLVMMAAAALAGSSAIAAAITIDSDLRPGSRSDFDPRENAEHLE
jgi:EmrB/QacA subfamily drug resistance transporter